MIVYIIGAIILILLGLFIFIFLKYSKLKDLSNSLDICMDNIDSVLEKKLELINSLLKLIKDNKIKDKFAYDENKNLYDRETTLFDTAFAINKYASNGKSKKLKDGVKVLSKIEEELDALKDYYNNKAKIYNTIYKNKVLNKIWSLLKLDSYQLFTIKKLEEYEVFKN